MQGSCTMSDLFNTNEPVPRVATEVLMLRRFRIGIVTAALLALPLATTMAEDPTVDEIIANNIEAKGGRDKIDSVASLKIAGRVSMGGGMEAPFTLEIKRPNKMRMEFTFQG